MNAANNFTATGFVAADAQVKNVGKSSIVRFGIFIKETRTDKDGQKQSVSAPMWFERHIKTDDSEFTKLIVKNNLVKVTGFFQPEQWTDKDGNKQDRIKNIALSVEDAHKKVEA